MCSLVSRCFFLWISLKLGDIIGLMQSQLLSGEPDMRELNAFLDGYGLHTDDLSDMKPLLLLKAFDNLRWAIDRRPDLTDSYAAAAKQAVCIALL